MLPSNFSQTLLEETITSPIGDGLPSKDHVLMGAAGLLPYVELSEPFVPALRRQIKIQIAFIIQTHKLRKRTGCTASLFPTAAPYCCIQTHSSVTPRVSISCGMLAYLDYAWTFSRNRGDLAIGLGFRSPDLPTPPELVSPSSSSWDCRGRSCLALSDRSPGWEAAPAGLFRAGMRKGVHSSSPVPCRGRGEPAIRTFLQEAPEREDRRVPAQAWFATGNRFGCRHPRLCIRRRSTGS